MTRFRFGTFTLTPGTRSLARDGNEIVLTPKAFDVLTLLVRSRERVVTKQELLDTIWPGIAITENTLTQRIKEIREALGDDVRNVSYVRTMSRVGYRFVADVVEELEPPSQNQAGEAPAPVPASEAVEEVSPEAPSVVEPRPGRRSTVIALSAAVALAVAVGVWVLSGLLSHEAPSRRHRLVSTFDGSHWSASLSPDGQLMAFVSDRTGVPQVWIKPVRDGTPIQITFGDVPAGRPQWSPRGDQIVFERRGQGIWTVSPLGGNARPLIEAGRSPQFSRDGSTLVFERAAGGWGLWLADADGGNARRVSGTPDTLWWAEPTFPAISPDGQWIAFTRRSQGPRGDLWVVRTSGGSARQLTFDECEIGAPAWTPDGGSIIYPSERRGSRTLWKISTEGGEPEPITTGAGWDDEPRLTPDGRSILYTNYKDRHGLVAWDPVRKARQVILERAVPLIMPTVSPIGDRVAFFMAVDTALHVFTVGLDGSDLRQVTHGANHENLHPSWSWDGRSLYYYQRKPETGWRRIGSDGQGDTELIPDWTWSTHNNARIDPSSRFVLFTRIGFDTGDYSKDSTYVRSLADGTERALPPPHLHMAFWSPDGREVAGWRHDGGVGVCDVTAGACRSVTKGNRPFWTADGSLIFQRNSTDTSAELWRIDAAGREETRLGQLGPYHPASPNVELTPDGRVVFAEYQKGRRELWLLDWN